MLYQKKNFVTTNVMMACRSTGNAKKNLKDGIRLPLTPSDTVKQLKKTLQTQESKN